MFSRFALHERLLKALNTLNFHEPTAVQSATIPLALEGKDLQVIARTGSGKTAAFVLPLLNRLLNEPKQPATIRVLILLPTRELARQTLGEIERFAQFTFLKAGLITGGEGFKEQAAMLRKVPDILVGTPGRLVEQAGAGNLLLQDIEVLVLDEADRMLDMGLADDVRQLAERCGGPHQTLMFSATSGGKALQALIQQLLHEPQHVLLDRRDELNESTRQQIITADHQQHKEQLLDWLLHNEPYERAVIFTNTRVQADRLYGRLVAAGVKAFVLHGEKDQKDRKLALERFRQGTSKVLVATDVAARGLDIGGLDLVINFDMPHSGDDYVHRIGRTGRAGGEGLAISLIEHTEWDRMSSIERYLKQRFERRSIKELKGRYQGPKKLKASGKAAGSKKKKTTKETRRKTVKKPTARPNKKPALIGSQDGLAPLKRRKPAESEQ